MYLRFKTTCAWIHIYKPLYVRRLNDWVWCGIRTQLLGRGLREGKLLPHKKASIVRSYITYQTLNTIISCPEHAPVVLTWVILTLSILVTLGTWIYWNIMNAFHLATHIICNYISIFALERFCWWNQSYAWYHGHCPNIHFNHYIDEMVWYLTLHLSTLILLRLSWL